MYLKTRICTAIAGVVLISASLAPTAAAAEPSFWDQVKSVGSGVYQSVKEATPGLIDQGKELAGAAVDKAGDLYDAAKDKVPAAVDKAKDGLQNAGEQFAEFRADQQEQFWAWFAQQTNTNAGERANAAEQTPPAGFYEIGGQIFYFDPERGTLEPARALESATPDTSTPASINLETTPDSAPATEAKKFPTLLDCLLLGSLCICVLFLFVVLGKYSAAMDDDYDRARESRREAYDAGFEAGRRRRD